MGTTTRARTPGATRVPATSAGTVLDLVRRGSAATRADLARITGLSRSTVSQRVDDLLAQGYLLEAGEGPSTGGRPPTRLIFNAGRGVVLAADLGATHGRLAVTDLTARSLAEEPIELSIADGPDVVLPFVQDRFKELLDEVGRTTADVRGIGIGVPGPVEFAAGRTVNPPIMPGWDSVVIPQRLAERFDGIPVLVDNDVNIMGLGEYWTYWRGEVDDLLYVKVASGIGCGVIVGGEVHRGAQGTAGDLGHIRLCDDSDTVCRCGNQGCVEAVASGSALARQATELGLPASTSRDVVALVRGGQPDAVRLVRRAGRRLGEVLAAAVNLFNPSVIVIGGDLAHAHEQLLAGIREVVYQRSTVLATRHLQIVRSRLDDRAGVVGAAVTVVEHVLAPASVDGGFPDRGELEEPA
jgi:predicted NBD/HSP70 family sugar kinase